LSNIKTINGSIKKGRFKFPHAIIILLGIIIIFTIASYIIPAGQFERVVDPNTGRNMVQAGSFHYVDKTPVNFLEMLAGIVKGFVSAGDIIFLVFFAYANVFMILKAGAFHGLISSVLIKTKGKEKFIIPIFIIIFGLCGSTYGEFETIYGLIPIFIGFSIALGYDAIVGLSITGMAVAIGFAAATTNPFTIGIGQGIAGLPIFSGLLYRWIIFVVFISIAIWWTMRYAEKIKKNPELSLVKDIDFKELAINREDITNVKFTWKHKLMITVFLLTVITMVFGCLKLGWWFNEMSGLFLLGMIICGTIAGYSPNKIAEYWIEACNAMITAALIIGLARAILVVMTEGTIIDTVIYGLYQPIRGLSSWVAAGGMLVAQTIINFFIPSGSGQAVTTMPIMVGLSDLTGVTRQVAVLAEQFGDGFSNLLWPTCGIAIMLGVGKIPFDRWYKYFLPLFGILFLVQIVFLFVAVSIGYGPF